MTATPDLDLAAALRGSRLFAELPQADVAALAATSRSVDLAPATSVRYSTPIFSDASIRSIR